MKHHDQALKQLNWEQALFFLRTQGESFGFYINDPDVATETVKTETVKKEKTEEPTNQ